MSRSRLDFSQIMQHAYDEQSEALKTVPAAEQSFAVELSADDGDSVEIRRMAEQLILFDGHSADDAECSEVMYVLHYSTLFVSVSWQGLTSNDASVKIEYSADGETFHDASTIVLGSSSGKNSYRDSQMGCSHLRVTYAKGMNSAGQVTVKAVVKG